MLKAIMKKLKKRKSDQSKFESNNLKDIIGDIIVKDSIAINNGKYFIFLKIFPINFALKSYEEQEYIINRYEDLLKVMNTDFSIFTIAKRSDGKKHLDYIKSLYTKEDNENVKNMTKEYEEYVRKESLESGVERQFIVVIPYKGIQTTDFSVIKSYLYQKRRMFKEQIEKCTNEATILDDNHTKAIYYELLNKKTAERQRYV